MKKLTHIHITVFWLLSLVAAEAQITWSGDGGDGKWGTAANWSDGNVPDNNSETAQYSGTADLSIEIDGDFTIKSFADSFGGPDSTTTLGGAGNLVIDVNGTAATSIGLDNATGTTGGTLRFTGNVMISNSGTGVTIIRNTNSATNRIRFDTGSVLTLKTLTRTNAAATALGSLIEFNGTLAASEAALQIGSNNVSFGTGHDSTGFGQDLILLVNSKLAVNGGSVLSVGRKFQVNGNAELELNSANSINGANIVVGGANTLTLDVNADQADLGLVNFSGSATGTLAIDLDPAVTLLAFDELYAQNWVSGTLSITGFKEGTVRFGTDGAGLSRAQLDTIDGGLYSLTPDGYLTTQSFQYWARYQIGPEGYVLMSPWIERWAYVDAAPFVWILGAGWVFLEEGVGLDGFGWAYAYDLEGLDISVFDGSGFGYSFGLDRWVYAPYDLSGVPAGWVYLL